ncbi:pH-responsive protein 1 [Smittium culicis]|uniref:1,3-beta-glucanosyltransferase n=1 Tax=Smittium culicis TaxID=133412 RepID=A0A1R1XJJ0_9FUNG|nr:pH-responsive protein 1 [Smittium culicis]
MKEENINKYVGYTDNDDIDIRVQISQYLNCGNDSMSRADFYGINTYSWCNNKNTYESSGYKDMAEPLRNYSIRVIITEFGCVPPDGREFNEVATIFGPQMTDTFSGGIAYEFSNKLNYGIVDIKDGAIIKKPDYFNLKKSFSNISIFDYGISLNTYKDSKIISECPKVSINSRSNSEKLPPKPNENFCKCIEDSMRCKIGTVNISKNALSTESGKALDYLCGKIDCDEISNDSSLGKYGIISSCSSLILSNFIVNKNFISNKMDPDFCKYPIIGSSISHSPVVKSYLSCKL